MPRSLFLAIFLAGCASSVPTAAPRTKATTDAAPSSAPPSPSQESADAPLADAATWERWSNADYAMLAPRRFADALAPLVRHREANGHVVALVAVEDWFARFSRGAPDARALERGLKQLASHASGKLRFVLLAGDVTSEAAPVPTFYLRKLSYERHTPDEHRLAVSADEHRTYPSDQPYATLDRAARALAVGRIPARTEGELRAFVKKVVDYETAPDAGGVWRRRVNVLAGPANFGDVADAMIESITGHLLDDELSYDYDVGFTFAKYDSPYAYRFDKLQDKFVSDLDEGALVAAYVGHGASTAFMNVYFRGRSYELGTVADAERLHIGPGKPLFFSIACDTGAFDRPDGAPSLAERMALNPDGPIGVVASSRESHPYANALLGEAVLDRFTKSRAPTIGEGLVAAKEAMLALSLPAAELLIDVDVEALKKEHLGLYNLFGDPATRLRYPDPVNLKLSTAMPNAGDAITIELEAPSIARGKALVTLETPRSKVRGRITPGDAIDAMPTAQAFAAMEQNHKLASDKIVQRVEVEVTSGRATASVRVPPLKDARFVVKAVAWTSSSAAAGHATLKTNP